MLDTHRPGAKLIKQTTEDESMDRQQMAKTLEGMIQSQVDGEIIMVDTTLDGSWKRVSIKRADTGMEITSLNLDDFYHSPAVQSVMRLVDRVQRALA